MPQLRSFTQLGLASPVALPWLAAIARYFPKAHVQLCYFSLRLRAPTKRYHISKKLLVLSLLIFTLSLQMSLMSLTSALPGKGMN